MPRRNETSILVESSLIVDEHWRGLTQHFVEDSLRFDRIAGLARLTGLGKHGEAASRPPLALTADPFSATFPTIEAAT